MICYIHYNYIYFTLKLFTINWEKLKKNRRHVIFVNRKKHITAGQLKYSLLNI
jgi:hypothetical protein